MLMSPTFAVLIIISNFASIINSQATVTPRRNCVNDSVAVGLMMQGHNKRVVPRGYPREGNPVEVDVQVWVQDVSRILESTSEFELDIYVTEVWMDKTLTFEQYKPCREYLSLRADKFLHKIWLPSSVFVNSKNASIHDSPYRNIFLMVYMNGSVWLNYRIKLIGPCRKDLKTFPIDNQHCTLMYESILYNNERVSMLWNPSPVTFLKKIVLPDYSLNESEVMTDKFVRFYFIRELWLQTGCKLFEYSFGKNLILQDELLICQIGHTQYSSLHNEADTGPRYYFCGGFDLDPSLCKLGPVFHFEEVKIF